MVITRYYAAALGGLGGAVAGATNGSCTFDDIAPSTELNWCPCGTNFFCAKLEVDIRASWSHRHRRLTVDRSRWITRTRAMAVRLFHS